MPDVALLKAAEAVGFIVFLSKGKFYYARPEHESEPRRWSFPFNSADDAAHAVLALDTIFWGNRVTV